ncbi:hypothetical protein M409DRAFT_25747 [Zasmidium cellare ATCC 36951]|uniref:Uncharacterized protein n=1 Tax=Zasmidium cellare ATCC 36951 TaxID=1080233 RepID=A0A6A6CAZ9_ZASCE|nr:uncharacterized protein M409DRAFT_25747 [Zasmidium cellare ATCC 36951]KAF2163973.1 hypothetical protein M409DRAFT_25747 [Zasmidium cellare ATCC 36951]
MAQHIFRFFDLPAEIRDMVYGYLTDETSFPHAEIKTPHLPSIIRLAFQGMWVPRLLLINKQFKDEYFDYVCAYQLRCYVVMSIRPPLYQRSTPHNPSSAMACLSKVRTLIGTRGAEPWWYFDEHCTAFNNVIAALLADLPSLKTFEERLCCRLCDFEELLGRGNDSALRIMQGDAGRFAAARLRHDVSRDITHKRALGIQAPLYFDFERNSDEWSPRVDWIATPVAGKVKPEYLWHGFALEAITD